MENVVAGPDKNGEHMAKNTTTAGPDGPPSLFAELKTKIKEHRLPIFAAGVAFFAFIALIPALAAAVSITSLVADPQVLEDEVNTALSNSPEELSLIHI